MTSLVDGQHCIPSDQPVGFRRSRALVAAVFNYIMYIGISTSSAVTLSGGVFSFFAVGAMYDDTHYP